MAMKLKIYIKHTLTVFILLQCTACATNFRQALQNLEAQNYPEALAFFEKDAKLGYRIAAIQAANLYSIDYQIPRNLAKSKQYLDMALKADYGIYDQAYDYYIPLIKAYQILADTTQHDKSQAFSILQYKKYQDYYWAQATLAHCHLIGYGTALDLNKATMYFERAIENNIYTQFNTFYAWWLAVYPEQGFRNPKRSLAMVQNIISDSKLMNKPLILDTIAAVYAANGDFAKAQSTQLKAISRLNTYILKYPYMTLYSEALKTRLSTYQQNKAWTFSLEDIQRCGYNSKRCLNEPLLPVNKLLPAQKNSTLRPYQYPQRIVMPK